MTVSSELNCPGSCDPAPSEQCIVFIIRNFLKQRGLQFSYNLLNLPAQIKSGSTVKANYTYLSDGTKAAAYTSTSAGKDYVGSFTYTRGSGGSKTLESVAFRGALPAASLPGW